MARVPARAARRAAAAELVQLPLAWSLRAAAAQRPARARGAAAARARRLGRSSGGGSPPTCTTASSRTSPACRSRSPRPAAAERAPTADAPRRCERRARDARESVRELRTLLVDIYPPSLHAPGLAAALDDLLAPLARAASRPTLEPIRATRACPRTTEALALPRRAGGAAQRRQARRRRRASTVARERATDGARRARPSRDDGRGFDAAGGGARRRATSGCGCSRTWPRDAGGRLDVESRAGRGTARARGGAAPMIRVLLADDHALRARRARAAARPRRRTSRSSARAADGAEARRARRRAEPDVVLMDLSMPGIDGVEATRRDRAPRSPRRAVVVLTSFSDRERILDALDAGAVGYLLKDAEPDELLRGDPRRGARRVAAGPEAAQRAAGRAARAAPAGDLTRARARGARAASPRACRTS